MMRHLKSPEVLLLACLTLLSFCSSATIVAAEASSVPESTEELPFSLNVKSFGAKGDGVTDDTAAIQRAADAAMIRPPQRDWMCTRYYKAMHDAPAHEIFFPAGTYVISGPVVFNWSVSLRGTAGTTIRNTAPDKDSFFFEYALRCTIEKLKFDGGFHQIRHWTNNLDTSTLLISHCEFRNAAKVSIHSASYRQRTEKQYKSRLEEIKAGVPQLRISPYIVERKNGKVTLIPRPEETLQEFENSSNLIVRDCVFENNVCALDMRSDGIVIQDSVIRTPRNMPEAAVRIGCKAHLTRLKFDLLRDPAREQYAISQYGGNVMISDSEFSSDHAVTVLHCHAKPYSSMIGSSTALRKLKLATGTAPVIRFAADSFPNLLSICALTTDSRSAPKLFDFAKAPTAEELNAWLKGKRHPDLGPGRSYGISVTDAEKFDRSLPESLARYVRDIPSGSYQTPQIDRTSLQFTGPILSDPLIGGEKNDTNDDTARLEALLARAAKSTGAIIVLPPRWIRVGKTLFVPDNTQILAAGRAIIQARSDDFPVFRIKKCDRVMFKNITFHKGMRGVEISARQGSIQFDNCCFYDQLQETIKAYVPDNKLRLTVTGGCAYTPFFYTGNAAPAYFESLWYSNLPDYPKEEYKRSYASIANRGGELYITDMLGVPTYFRHVTPMHEIWRKAPGKGGHFRWIDNTGKLWSLNNRFGGEWGGLTPVYQYGRNSATYLEGAYCCLNCPRTRNNSPVLTDSPDADVTLVNVVSTLYNEPLQTTFRQKDGSVKPLPKQGIYSSYPLPALKSNSESQCD